jgi:hypothetical protein
MMENCIMKVKFSRIFYALFSRFSRLNNPTGIPDSNLLTLNRAAEYSQTTRACNECILSQNHETKIKKGQLLLRYLKFTVMPTCQRRGESSSKSQGVIRAAEYFIPL